MTKNAAYTVAYLIESRLLVKNHRQSYNTHTQDASLWVKVRLAYTASAQSVSSVSGFRN